MRFFLISLCCSLYAFSALPEEPRFLGDYANLLSAAEEAQLTEKLRTYQQEAGKEVKVLTVRSISEFQGSPQHFEQFATFLFNHWGIGDPSLNDGVLFLVSKNDRKMRIEVGSGYGSALNAQMETVISETVIPAFKQGRFSQGILSGTDHVFRVLTNYEYDAESSTVPLSREAELPRIAQPETIKRDYPLPLPRAEDGEKMSFIGWLLAGGASLVGLLFGISKCLPKKCKPCQVKMVMLSEAEEDDYLDEKQQFEERIGSVEYDVWECPSCSDIDIQRKSRIFSGYDKCPSCKTKALNNTSKVIRHATTFSSGLKRIYSECEYCGHSFTTDRRIPKKTDNSNSGFSGRSSGGGFSGGGSSGGGSSSGGGASGSW